MIPEVGLLMYPVIPTWSQHKQATGVSVSEVTIKKLIS